MKQEYKEIHCVTTYNYRSNHREGVWTETPRDLYTQLLNIISNDGVATKSDITTVEIELNSGRYVKIQVWHHPKTAFRGEDVTGGNEVSLWFNVKRKMKKTLFRRYRHITYKDRGYADFSFDVEHDNQEEIENLAKKITNILKDY